jgi:hypothetical protein
MDSENGKALRTGYFTEIAEDGKLKGNTVCR